MGQVILQSQPNVWLPTPTESSKLLQTGCEVTALSLKAGGGPVHVSLYDCKDSNGANPNALRWTLDAAQQDTDSETFASPLIFRKGLFAVCDEGLDFNAQVCYASLKYPSN